MFAELHVHVVRLAAIIEIGSIVMLFAMSLPGALRNWFETRKMGGTAYHIALGRVMRLLFVVMWGGALFLGMLSHWDAPVSWRYILYVGACPLGFISWLLLDRNRWRDAG